MLNTAINSNDMDDWRMFKHFRNTVSRSIDKAKKIYFDNKFDNNNDKWKTLRDVTGNNKTKTPKTIIHNGNPVVSPQKIANIANEFFISKINLIRQNFQNFNVCPMEVLKTLIPRTDNNLYIPKITILETIQLIKDLKPSNSTGHDELTSNILKKINVEIAPHITHLINSIINTSIYPEIFKISKLLPFCKPDKNENFIDSFRPINNLTVIDKLVQEYIKIHLLKHLENNQILHENHHGGLKHHSTITALTQINNILASNQQDNKFSLLFTTDLQACFDTVDIDLLMCKMEHYGIRGPNIKLFRSLLSNIKQFTQVDCFDSNILD